MDALEKFIRQQQEALKEQFEPREDLWEKISARLDEDQEEQKNILLPPPEKPFGEKGGSITISYRRLWQAAAAVILLIIVGYWATQGYLSRQDSPQVAQEQPLRKLNPELAEAEAYYTSLIRERQEELRQIAPKEFEEFEQDMKSLDAAYTELLKELKKNPSQEKITAAMIQNLRLRIEILDDQIQLLERYKKQNSPQKDEKVYL
jgi:hypothetical protein